VVNAGDGAHEHPTQALLDALTIRRAKGRIAGLVVAICGDVLHSRVARSNILLLNALGARVRVVTEAGSAETPVEVSDTVRSGHITLPNGLGVDNATPGGDGGERVGVAPNELTSAGRRDPFAGTPWHKNVPARVEPVP
jgi:hypothetical protein